MKEKASEKKACAGVLGEMRCVCAQFIHESHHIKVSTDCGVPPAEIDHGLILYDHNCGDKVHLL